MQANAAEDAAAQQAGGAANATAEQRRQFNATQARLQPWTQTGAASIAKLGDYLGLQMPPSGEAPTRAQFTTTGPAGGYFGPATQSTDYSGARSGGPQWVSTPGATTFDQVGFDKATAAYNAPQAPGPNTGSLLRQFTGESVATDPGYQFGMQQGELGLQRRASASGMRLSPATQKALDRFNQDYAGTKFNEAFNRDLAQKQFTYNTLAGVSDQGRGAANTVGVLGQQTATQIGENTMGAANAGAAGTVGAANAWAGGLNNAGNQFMNYQMLDRYLNNGSGTRAGGTGMYAAAPNDYPI
jgi:hypothetical protein